MTVGALSQSGQLTAARDIPLSARHPSKDLEHDHQATRLIHSQIPSSTHRTNPSTFGDGRRLHILPPSLLLYTVLLTTSSFAIPLLLPCRSPSPLCIILK